MKFDCVIMNPPQCRNLHLKILAEAIKHLKDDESVCVNLSPIRWLQDPLAKYKKHTDYTRFESSISKHIENVIIIKASEANNLFNIKNFTDLGIYVCKKYTKNNYDYENTLANEYLGNKKLARVVGNILHNNPDEDKYPCYKVVDCKGNLSKHFVFGGIEKQKEKLEKEGIVVSDYKVNLDKYKMR